MDGDDKLKRLEQVRRCAVALESLVTGNQSQQHFLDEQLVQSKDDELSELRSQMQLLLARIPSTVENAPVAVVSEPASTKQSKTLRAAPSKIVQPPMRTRSPRPIAQAPQPAAAKAASAAALHRSRPPPPPQRGERALSPRLPAGQAGRLQRVPPPRASSLSAPVRSGLAVRATAAVGAEALGALPPLPPSPHPTRVATPGPAAAQPVLKAGVTRTRAPMPQKAPAGTVNSAAKTAVPKAGRAAPASAAPPKLPTTRASAPIDAATAAGVAADADASSSAIPLRTAEALIGPPNPERLARAALSTVSAALGSAARSNAAALSALGVSSGDSSSVIGALFSPTAVLALALPTKLVPAVARLVLCPGVNAARRMYASYPELTAADVDEQRIAEALRPAHGWSSRTEAHTLLVLESKLQPPVGPKRMITASVAAVKTEAPMHESGGMLLPPCRVSVFAPSGSDGRMAAPRAALKHMLEPQQVHGFNGTLGDPTLIVLPAHFAAARLVGGAPTAATAGDAGTDSTDAGPLLLFSVGCVAGIISASEYAAVGAAPTSCVSRDADGLTPGSGASLYSDISLTSPFLSSSELSGHLATTANPLLLDASTTSAAVAARDSAVLRYLSSRRQALFCGHDGHIVASAVHPALPIVATAQVAANAGINTSPKIILWSPATLQAVSAPLELPPTCGRAVTSLAFSSDGQFLLALVSDPLPPPLPHPGIQGRAASPLGKVMVKAGLRAATFLTAAPPLRPSIRGSNGAVGGVPATALLVWALASLPNPATASSSAAGLAVSAAIEPLVLTALELGAQAGDLLFRLCPVASLGGGVASPPLKPQPHAENTASLAALAASMSSAAPSAVVLARTAVFSLFVSPAEAEAPPALRISVSSKRLAVPKGLMSSSAYFTAGAAAVIPAPPATAAGTANSGGVTATSGTLTYLGTSSGAVLAFRDGCFDCALREAGVEPVTALSLARYSGLATAEPVLIAGSAQGSVTVLRHLVDWAAPVSASSAARARSRSRSRGRISDATASASKVPAGLGTSVLALIGRLLLPSPAAGMPVAVAGSVVLRLSAEPYSQLPVQRPVAEAAAEGSQSSAAPHAEEGSMQANDLAVADVSTRATVKRQRRRRSWLAQSRTLGGFGESAPPRNEEDSGGESSESESSESSSSSESQRNGSGSGTERSSSSGSGGDSSGASGGGDATAKPSIIDAVPSPSQSSSLASPAFVDSPRKDAGGMLSVRLYAGTAAGALLRYVVADSSVDVFAPALLPGPQLLASMGGRALLVDRDAVRCEVLDAGCAAAALCVATHPTLPLYAVGTSDSHVTIFESLSGTPLATARVGGPVVGDAATAPPLCVTALDFSPDGCVLVATLASSPRSLDGATPDVPPPQQQQGSPQSARGGPRSPREGGAAGNAVGPASRTGFSVLRVLCSQTLLQRLVCSTISGSVSASADPDAVIAAQSPWAALRLPPAGSVAGQASGRPSAAAAAVKGSTPRQPSVPHLLRPCSLDVMATVLHTHRSGAPRCARFAPPGTPLATTLTAGALVTSPTAVGIGLFGAAPKGRLSNPRGSSSRVSSSGLPAPTNIASGTTPPAPASPGAATTSTTFAVGYDDGIVEVYVLDVSDVLRSTSSSSVLTDDLLNGLRRRRTLKASPSQGGILQLDWDARCRFLIGATSTYQLVAWDVPASSVVPSLASLRDVVWATQSAMFGWPVSGIWQSPQTNTNDTSPPLPPPTPPTRGRTSGGTGVAKATVNALPAPSMSGPSHAETRANTTPAVSYANVLSVRRNRGGAEVLLVACAEGALRLYDYPALHANSSRYVERTVHGAYVSGADFIAGDQQVVSVSAADGSIACWALQLATAGSSDDAVAEAVAAEDRLLLQRLQKLQHAPPALAIADLWRAYAASLDDGGGISALQWRPAGPDGSLGPSAAAAATKHEVMRRVEASIASHASAVVKESLAERAADQRKHLLSAYMGPAALSAKKAAAAVSGAGSSSTAVHKRILQGGLEVEAAPEGTTAGAATANAKRSGPESSAATGTDGVASTSSAASAKSPARGGPADVTSFAGTNPMARFRVTK